MCTKIRISIDKSVFEVLNITELDVICLITVVSLSSSEPPGL